MSETATRNFSAKKANGNAITVWVVDSFSQLPTSNVTEGDVGFCIDQGLFYERDINTSGWTLKWDGSAIDGTIEPGDIVGLEAFVEAFLTDEFAAKADASHTHPESDITNLVSDLAGKAASVHTHSPADITFAATDKLLGRVSASGGAGEEVTCTDFAQSLLDDTTQGTARTTLGVGTADSPEFTAVNVGHASDTTLARLSAGDLSVEGNRIFRVGGTDVPIADGGTGASTALAAFDALSPLTTRGDVLTRDASNNIRLAAGSYGQSPWWDGTDLTKKSTSFIGGFVSPTFTTSSTSYVDVTGLTIALPANLIFAFEVYGTFTTSDNASGTTNGIGFSVNGTGGTGQAAVYTIWIQTTAPNTSGNNTTSTTPFSIRNENTFNSMTALTSVVSISASLVFMMKGFYYTGTSGDSTLAIRVRSENASPQSASVQVGSYMLLTKQG